MHKRAHSGTSHRILWREGSFWRNLVEVFDDDRRIDDDCAVVIERGHNSVGIEFEVFGPELVAFEEIQFHFVEWQLFRVKNEPDPLAAGRLRRVIQPETHLELLIGWYSLG